MSNKSLRLLVTKECDRSCRGCCNKDWDLDSLPVETDYTGYDEIILTGGEPMLDPVNVLKIIREVRHQTNAHIIVYTAKTDDPSALLQVMRRADSLTITLHSKSDVRPFRIFYENWEYLRRRDPGLRRVIRLNVFKGVPVPKVSPFWVSVKSDIEWIKDCPLPQNETFARIPKGGPQ